MSESNSIKINLGSGRFPLPGFVNVDIMPLFTDPTGTPVKPDVCIDLIDYLRSLEDEVAIEVYAGHVLEHFTREESLDIVREVRRVLLPGGVFSVTVPNMSAAIDLFKHGLLDYNTLHGAIYGELKNEYEIHKQVIDYDLLIRLVEPFFSGVERLFSCDYWPAVVNWQCAAKFTK